ncbi:hypothetical protein ACHWQZ_G002687 [Mnemiopsis leidyi]
MNEISNYEVTSSENLRHKIYRNLAVLCFTFLGVFTAFQSSSGLQSTGITGGTNSKFSAVAGHIPLLVIYIVLVPSSAFLTHIVIDRLGTRWTLIFCQIPYILYICTFYYPHLSLTVPFGILIGITAAPLWTASYQYLCSLAERYALLFKSNLSHSYSLFFGLYFMVFLTTGAWGSLIYYVVHTLFSSGNDTTKTTMSCGLDYDYSAMSSYEKEFGHRSTRIKFNLLSSYLSIAIVSVILLAMYMESKDDDEEEDTSLVSSLFKTCSKLNLDQALLIPITVWSGVEQAFMMSVFSESFVICNFGSKTHAVMMITYGLSGSLSSLAFGLLRRYIPMRVIFLIASLLNCTVFALSLVDSKGALAIHLCVAAWGLAEGIWQPQIGVVYAEKFPEDQVSAFSHYRLWESLGYILVFSLKLGQVDVSVIIFIVIIILASGMVGYLALQWKSKRETHSIISPSNVKNED